MSDKINSIIESIEGLNVLELVELKKTMEDKWGVTAAAPMMTPGPSETPSAIVALGSIAAPASEGGSSG